MEELRNNEETHSRPSSLYGKVVYSKERSALCSTGSIKSALPVFKVEVDVLEVPMFYL